MSERCDHEEWDYRDRNAGIAECCDCGKTWFMTPEQIKRADELEAMAEEEWNRDRPCIRCGEPMAGHTCTVTDEEWLKPSDDDKIPF